MKNKVILIGRLGKDPELRELQSGQKVTSFNLATSESYKDKEGNKVEETEWHTITGWGKLAEIMNTYLKKGDRVYIEGKIKTKKVEKEGQEAKYYTSITAREMIMLGDKKDGDSSSSKSSAAVSDDDDLPF